MSKESQRSRPVVTSLYLPSVMPQEVLIGDPKSLPTSVLVFTVVVGGLALPTTRAAAIDNSQTGITDNRMNGE